MGISKRDEGSKVSSEINVTPMVDVMLVLLIIFMITAHAMDTGIEIDVPKTKMVSTTSKELPIVAISKSGNLYLGNDPVNINRLVDAIHNKYPGQNAVYIKADRETTMDLGVNVMSVLGNAKFGVNVVTELDEGHGKR